MRRVYHGTVRYKLHRVLPMRALKGLQRALSRRYWRTKDETTRKALDALAWFTTPYRGARDDSGVTHAAEEMHELRYYEPHFFNSRNVHWWMLRTNGPRKHRALGL